MKMMPKTLILAAFALAAGFWGWGYHSDDGAPANQPIVTSAPATSVATATTATASAAAPSADAEAAIRRSLAVLQEEGLAWFEGRSRVQDGGDGCVSCHQVPFGVWALLEAERAGVSENPDAVTDLTRNALEFVSRPGVARTMSWGPMILATEADVAVEADFVDFLLEQQTTQGFWEARGQFPSQRRDLDETNAVASMWTILALAPLAPVATPATDSRPDRALSKSTAVGESIDKANAWIEQLGDGESTEWLVLRFLTLEALGSTERAAKLHEELILQQNVDGGWSWLAGEGSNPLSTGQALYGLQARQVPPGEAQQEAVRRGIAYLAASQGPDGLWTTSSALTSRERSDDRDYVYDYWGTAWATIGLSKTPSAPSTSSDPPSENKTVPAS